MTKTNTRLNILFGAIAATLALTVSVPHSGAPSLISGAQASEGGGGTSIFETLRKQEAERRARNQRIRNFHARNEVRRLSIRAIRAVKQAARAAERAKRRAERARQRANRRAARDARRARLWALNGRVYRPMPDYAYNHSNGRLAVGVAPGVRYVAPDGRFSYSY